MKFEDSNEGKEVESSENSTESVALVKNETYFAKPSFIEIHFRDW